MSKQSKIMADGKGAIKLFMKEAFEQPKTKKEQNTDENLLEDYRKTYQSRINSFKPQIEKKLKLIDKEIEEIIEMMEIADALDNSLNAIAERLEIPYKSTFGQQLTNVWMESL